MEYLVGIVILIVLCAPWVVLLSCIVYVAKHAERRGRESLSPEWFPAWIGICIALGAGALIAATGFMILGGLRVLHSPIQFDTDKGLVVVILAMLLPVPLVLGFQLVVIDGLNQEWTRARSMRGSLIVPVIIAALVAGAGVYRAAPEHRFEQYLGVPLPPGVTQMVLTEQWSIMGNGFTIDLSLRPGQVTPLSEQLNHPDHTYHDIIEARPNHDGSQLTVKVYFDD